MIGEKVRIAAVGLGNRTCKYLRFVEMNPSLACVVAVSDRDEKRLSVTRGKFDLSENQCFTSADDFFSSGIQCDICIIGTPDHLHYEMTCKALENGWHVLLEKPMAQSLDECRSIVDLSKSSGLMVSVCYVLRYHPYFMKFKELVDSGDLGRILSVSHTERVGIDRTTHTYVRGPWSYREMNTSMFFSKCCHDVDFVLWLTGNDVKSVSSFSEGRPFDKAKAPSGCHERCIDCSMEGQCPYSAVDLYLRRRDWIRGFNPEPGETEEDTILRMLRDSRYGKCVYDCPLTDAVDRQTVMIEMESGIRSEIIMECITEQDNRLTRVECENAVISGDESSIKVTFKDGREEVSYDYAWTRKMGYHANADFKILEDMIEAVRTGRKEVRTVADNAIVSHVVCLLADDYIYGDKGRK